MLLPPLPHPLDIFRPSKVVFVLRLAHPPPLARRLRCPPTFRLPAVALPPVITRIADVLFPAMQAVECRVRFHRRAQFEPPNLREKPASTKKIHAPATPEEHEEQDQGRRVLWEAFEEDACREVSGFQTGQITGLSDRRPHPSACEFFVTIDAGHFLPACGRREIDCKRAMKPFACGRRKQTRTATHPQAGFPKKIPA